jgi:predicted esterase
MRTCLMILCIISTLISIQFTPLYSQNNTLKDNLTVSDSQKGTIEALISLLNSLSANSDNALFRHHCLSIIKVIETEQVINSYKLSFLEQIYTSFSNPNVEFNLSNIGSYLVRRRPFIISWVSPKDGITSVAWLLIPRNWDPDQTYPLYILLHGMGSQYNEKIEYMALNLLPDAQMWESFEDGYLLFPWGRGNIMYQDIGETDVLESVEALDSLVNIDDKRKYLTGFSMGGFGAWYIGQKYPKMWTALGVYAGSPSNGGISILDPEVIQALKDVPIYIVCGNSDYSYVVLQNVCQCLTNAGNQNVYFSSFTGGHESIPGNWQSMYNWLRGFPKDSLDQKETDGPVNALSLFKNYPNPFSRKTLISFSVPESGSYVYSSQVPYIVTLRIYNSTGNEVATLLNEPRAEGKYEIEFDASRLASGTYYCRITISNPKIRANVIKMSLIK